MGVFILLVAMIPLVIVKCPAEEEEPNRVPQSTAPVAKETPTPEVESTISQATWTIRGKVLFDPELHSHGPMVGEFPRNQGERYLPSWVYLEEDGGFAIDGILGGTYTLKVGDMDRPPLYEQAIELGPEGGELQLAEIDLREITRRIQIKVVDEDGLQPNFVVVKNLDGEFLGSGMYAPTFAEFLTTEEKLDVYVSAENCRRKLVKEVRGTIEVQLDPGIPLRLHIGNAPSMPKSWLWFVTLAPLDSDGEPNRQGSTHVHLESKQQLTRLPHAGSYRFILEALDVENTAGGVHSIPIPETTAEETTITLLDQEEPQEFRFTLTDEQRSYIESKVR